MYCPKSTSFIFIEVNLSEKREKKKYGPERFPLAFCTEAQKGSKKLEHLPSEEGNSQVYPVSKTLLTQFTPRFRIIIVRYYKDIFLIERKKYTKH
ncbi:hypothetical protein KAW38_01695 [Candidatus Micrarchaeota archaeon]|nr:hypothetical protein [Candidatus Micrarchaeota archaeon]